MSVSLCLRVARNMKREGKQQGQRGEGEGGSAHEGSAENKKAFAPIREQRGAGNKVGRG